MNFSRNTKYKIGQIEKHKRNKEVYAKNKAAKEERKQLKASIKDGPKGTQDE